jgi:hypothetical protein
MIDVDNLIQLLILEYLLRVTVFKIYEEHI